MCFALYTVTALLMNKITPNYRSIFYFKFCTECHVVLFVCRAIISPFVLQNVHRLTRAKIFRKFFRRVIIGLGRVGFYMKQTKLNCAGGFCIFFSIDRRVRSSGSPIPIFRFCRPGLTRSAAGHKNVDSVNERNWRFLFPSWRSSSRVLFYAPPLHSSSDSVVRKNADWILDFTSFSAPHLSARAEDAFSVYPYDLPRKRNY